MAEDRDGARAREVEQIKQRAWSWFKARTSPERRNTFLVLTQKLPEDTLIFMTHEVESIIDSRLIVGLPTEIVFHILEMLDVKTLCSLQLVCRRWYFAAGTNSIWKTKFQQLWHVTQEKGAPREMLWSWKNTYMFRSMANKWKLPVGTEATPADPKKPFYILVPSAWWAFYSSFAQGGTENKPFHPSLTAPLPPISSRALLEESGSMRAGLVKNVDFRLLREDVFKFLYPRLRQPGEQHAVIARCKMDNHGQPENIEVFQTSDAVQALLA